ncbi:MAG TPA: ferrous iron transport protein B [Pirellulales bacterium]|jgi:ferrous iron transport protein B|nr:ferrous iron transport protein B [Pirellulales bacterium]
MTTAAARRTCCVALIGNPNTGKSTLFNALAGVHQRVGNYPGVTVEKKLGHLQHGGRRYALIDLPGTYSLAPRSPDETVTVDVLLGRQDDVQPPDAVLCIVDATNLERNLYLVSQVLELGLPVVLALNMTDLARQRGIEIDVARLRQQLGVAVVPVQANRRIGLGELKDALARAADQPGSTPLSPFPAPFVEEVARLQTLAEERIGRSLPRFLVERLLLDSSGYLAGRLLGPDECLADELLEARARLAAAGCGVPAVEALSRYGWVAGVLTGVVQRPAVSPKTWTDRVDRLLTHRLLGTLIFLALMFVMFQAVFRWAKPAMDLIDGLTGSLGVWAGSLLPEGALRSLLVDGLIGGVGGVIIFLPQIMVLFFFIALLEDCGYMARAAYLMDRLMVRVGLSGKSFIPLLSSFACAIPGVMATRVIENRRDRLTTILVAPLMSCSARLPVYTLLIAAFIPNRKYLAGAVSLQALVMTAMYLLGIATAVCVAFVLKRTLLRGPTPPFVLELPSYKWPSVRTVAYRVLERGWAFVRRAGTLIVAVSIVVWAALYYPRDPQAAEGPFVAQREALDARLKSLPDESPQRAEIERQIADVDHQVAGAYRRQSFLGRLGHIIEPAVRPLGWDWRIGCAAIASFPAREVVVATLGIIYNLGEDLDLENQADANRLQATLTAARWEGTDRPVFNVPVALSIMVFFALCAQCASTLVIIKRETNTWRWPLFTFVYMTVLAYVAALVTYQVGMLLS